MAQDNKTAAMELDVLCNRALQRPPGQPAVEFEGRWHTWGELATVARHVNACLRAGSVAPGAQVALVARNHPDTLAAFLALLAGQYSVRMVYPFQSQTALAGNLENIAPAAVVAAASDLTATVQVPLQAMGITIVATDGRTPGAPDIPPTGTAEKTAPGGATSAPGVEVLTSGTTGKPKPFRLDYPTIARHIVGSIPTPGTDLAQESALPPTLLMFPVSNISGLYTTLPPLLRGQPIVLLERFTVAGWHDFVLRFKPPASGLPPAGVKMVLDAAIPPGDLASLKAVGTGAAPLDQGVKEAFEARYGIPILLSYGATEFGGPVTRMTPELQASWGERKAGSVGRALPGVRLRVVDPQSGRELAPGEQGILEVISPRIGGEWIRTSDLVVLDEDGFLFHHGRADGAIMRGGFKILPATVEHALLQHPALSQVCVIGVADARLGQVPAAAVELRPAAEQPTMAELEQFARDKLPTTHVPALWRAVASLPRTPSMKVDQPAVRRLFGPEEEQAK